MWIWVGKLGVIMVVITVAKMDNERGHHDLVDRARDLKGIPLKIPKIAKRNESE